MVSAETRDVSADVRHSWKRELGGRIAGSGWESEGGYLAGR
jgi:hypothetical protein